MKSAMTTISDKLLETGLDQEEIDFLLAQFLEEEAFDYIKFIVDTMEKYKSDLDEAYVLKNDNILLS